jgi:hypothetical protein
MPEDYFTEYDTEWTACDDYYQTDVPDEIEDEDEVIAYIEAEMVCEIEKYKPIGS